MIYCLNEFQSTIWFNLELNAESFLKIGVAFSGFIRIRWMNQSYFVTFSIALQIQVFSCVSLQIKKNGSRNGLYESAAITSDNCVFFLLLRTFDKSFSRELWN